MLIAQVSSGIGTLLFTQRSLPTIARNQMRQPACLVSAVACPCVFRTYFCEYQRDNLARLAVSLGVEPTSNDAAPSPIVGERPCGLAGDGTTREDGTSQSRFGSVLLATRDGRWHSSGWRCVDSRDWLTHCLSGVRTRAVWDFRITFVDRSAISPSKPLDLPTLQPLQHGTCE